MEQKIFSKFNAYDQIGYLMVGAIALLVFIFNLVYFYKLEIPSFNIDTFLVLFVIAYFLGHLIQGIANIMSDIWPLKFLIKENKENFSDSDKEILQKVADYFNLEKQSDKKLWSICLTFTTAKDITGQVQAFNVNYSLYRGWFVVFLLQSIFLLIHLFFAFSWALFWLLIASIFLVSLFHKRSKRFWNYTRIKAFETFLIIRSTK